MKLVRVRDTRRTGGRLYTKPSHVYSKLKELLLTNLCGHIDASTYICGEDYGGEVERLLLRETDRGMFKPELHPVKPYRDTDREVVAESIRETTVWLGAGALTVGSRIGSADPRVFWQVKRRASEFLDYLDLARVIEDSTREIIIFEFHPGTIPTPHVRYYS